MIMKWLSTCFVTFFWIGYIETCTSVHVFIVVGRQKNTTPGRTIIAYDDDDITIMIILDKVEKNYGKSGPNKFF